MPSPDASCRVGQAMYKLSAEHGDVLQREGGLAATLLYIDFFDLNTQRTAAATARVIRPLPACGAPIQ